MARSGAITATSETEVGSGATDPRPLFSTLENFSMKKTLIALAAVAATGAAFAQSSVTLYGRVDASIGQSKNTVTNVSTTQLFNGSAGGLTGSRWGMRGTEDLGGGLKAMFNLENRFNVDDGTTAGGFLGNAYVGLTGGFGTVHLGRSYNAYDYTQDLVVSKNLFDDTAFTADRNYGNSTRSANMIKYVSPTIAGFTAVASTGLAEGAVGGKNQNGLSVGYAAGPLAVRVGGQVAASGDAAAVAAGYDFGVVSVSGGYNQLSAPNNGNDSTGFSLGVNVPMGAFNLSAGVFSGKVETNAGAKITDETQFGLGATYSLSKRTRAYVGYKDSKLENARGVKTSGTRLYAAGVRHDF
jgi:predicted porin